MRTIQVINGPNLNLLGRREPDVYGRKDFETYLEQLHALFPEWEILYFQSNSEGALIDKLHEAGFTAKGIVLNAGGYTHTSVALRDAIQAIDVPVVEVHISNVYAREEFRHTSLISAVCRGVIAGFGLDSYRLAISFIDGLDSNENN
jgi:3-dehydroquinate dehydratase-2